MRRRHLRGVMAIERRVYTRPWSPGLFAAEMADSANRCYLVARLGGEVVGYGGVIVYDGEAHVTNVAVAPEHQRRGIAARVLHDLIEGAIALGAETVALEVRVTNWAAQRLYGRFGFRPVGIRKGYYQDVREDALIMWVDDVRGDDYRARLRAVADRLPAEVRP